MSDNAYVGGSSAGSIDSGGLNKGPTSASLADAIIRTNDTQPMSVPAGTVESGGANG